MKFVAALLLVVACVHASSLHFYGWTPGKEYVYNYESHVLHGIPEIQESHYSGVKLSSKVRIQAFSDYSLRVQVEEPVFFTVNGEVRLTETGRVIRRQNSESVKQDVIPEKFLRHLEEPFLAYLKNGVVESFRVSSEEQVSVTNIKKSVLSQIQLDIAASRRSQLETNHIQLPSVDETSDLVTYFTTSEESLQGECLTEYTIHQIPQWKVIELEESWTLEEQKLNGEEVPSFHQQSPMSETECSGKQYFKITKTKNMEQCKSNPVFSRFTLMTPKCDVTKSNCGKLVNHVTTTTAYVCGELNDFKVRKAVNDFVVNHSPMGFETEEKILTRSKVIVELIKTKPITQRLPVPSSTKVIKSLIYAYPEQMSEQSLLTVDQEVLRQTQEVLGVNPLLPQPGLTEAPKPLIPVTISKKTIIPQVMEEMKKVAQEIYVSPESCGCQSDLAAILSSIVKFMRQLSLTELEELEQKVLEESRIGHKTILMVFNDALASVGTNPSTMLVIKKIESESLSTPVSIKILSQAIRSVRYPTKQLMGKLVQLVQTIKSNKPLFATTLLQLSDLFYNAYINPISKINQFPTKVYGIFGSEQSPVLSEEYIPFLIKELQENESQYVRLVVVSALGKLGHIKVLEPLLKVTQIPRSVAILSLKRFAQLNPTVVRPILMSVITNPVEHPDVRIAAVSILPYAQPTLSELQKLSVISWFEQSLQVSSFVSSTLRSLAYTEIPELKSVALKSRTVLPLLKPTPIGIQHSHNINLSKAIEYLNMVISEDIKLINSKESLIPHLISLESNYYTNSVQVPASSFTAYMSNMDTILEKLLHYVGKTSTMSANVSSQLTKIAEELKLATPEFKSPELFLQQSLMGMESALYLNTDIVLKSIDSLSHKLGLQNSMDFTHASALELLEAENIGMTESGFPILSTVNLPVVFAVKGSVSMEPAEGETLAKVSAKIIPAFNVKVQSTSGVISPFTEELIGTVVEGSIHSSIPVEVGVKVTKGEVDITFKTPEEIVRRGPVTESLHAFITPYSVKQSLHTIKPLSHSDSVKMIESGINRQPLDIPIGQTLGLAGRLVAESDAKLTDISSYIQKIGQHSPLSLLVAGILPSSVRKSSVKIEYYPSRSETKEFNINVKLSNSGMRHALKSRFINPEELSHSSPVKQVVSQLTGQHDSATVLKVSATTKSIHQSKSLKTLIVLGKKSLGSYSNSVETVGAMEVQVPSGSVFGIRYEGNLEVPSLKYRWNIGKQIEEPMTLKYQGKLVVGRQGSEIELKVNTILSKTNELRRSIKESPELKKCLVEQHMGHKLSPTCVLVQQQAASLDKIELNIEIPKVISKSPVTSMLSDLVKALSIGQLEYLPASSVMSGFEMDTIKVEAIASRLSELAQVIIQTPRESMKISNVRLLGLTKTLFPFPILNEATTVLSQKMSSLEVPTACRVEPNMFTTFDNKTVSYTINDCEHVLVLDGSRKFPIGVLTKTVSGEKKMVKILSGLSEVELVPVSTGMKVLINGEIVRINAGEVVKKIGHTGSVIAFVKRYVDNTYLVTVPTQSLTVVTDGVSIEVSAPSYLKARAVGLCGDMNKEVSADLKTPRMCVMPSPLAAVSYILNKSGNSPSFPQCSGIPSQYREEFLQESQKCTKEHIIPTPVMSLYKSINSLNQPTTRSHMIESQGSKLCISKQMLKVCQGQLPTTSSWSGSSMGKPLSIKQRPVEFVCIKRSTGLAQSLEERVLSGESLNLELSELPISYRKVVVEPVTCSEPTLPITPSRW